MADLSQQDWKKQLEADNNSVVLDVRTQEEIDLGTIPNAIHIDIFKGQGFIYEIQRLDKSKNYYVYCKSGGRSGQACTIMNQLDIENAFKSLMEESGLKFGKIGPTVRVALVGGTVSPSIYDVVSVLGKEEVLDRLKKALVSLKD